MTRRSSGTLLVAVAACAWGTWPLLLRYAETYGPIDAWVESVVIMAVLTVASAPFVLRDRVRTRGSLRGWAGVAWMGVADAVQMALFFRAYQKTSVAIAVLTHYLSPVIVAVAAPVVLKERADRRTAGAVALSFTGLVVLLEPWSASVRGPAGALPEPENT